MEIQTINLFPDHYKGLKINKMKIEGKELLTLSLEQNAVFPEHTSPTNACLVVIEGQIDFKIGGKNHMLKAPQLFTFPKDVAHSVKARCNSRFLILR